MHKDIPINEASGVGIHSGHIQTTHYSSSGADLGNDGWGVEFV